MPRTDDALQPIVNIVPLQLLSYHLTLLRGYNVDQPRQGPLLGAWLQALSSACCSALGTRAAMPGLASCDSHKGAGSDNTRMPPLCRNLAKSVTVTEE